MTRANPHLRIQTLRWNGDRLEMIDQRLLPDRVEYLICRTAQDVADAIRIMVIRGAPAIGCAAAYGVALAGQSARNRPPAAFSGRLA